MSLENLMAKLESAAQNALDWFHSHGMKLNSTKCHLLVCGHKFECMLCEIRGSQIIETHLVKLLGANIESELTFKNHMGIVCRKASQKLNALSRLCSIIHFRKRRMLMQAFFISHFSYCPLVCMFHNRNINTRINISIGLCMYIKVYSNSHTFRNNNNRVELIFVPNDAESDQTPSD